MLVRKASLEAIEFHGLKIFDYTTDSNIKSSIALIEVPSGAVHPEAWSERSDKFYLATAGTVTFTLDGEQFILGSGDFCHVRQGCRFGYTNDSEQGATLMLVHTPSFDLNSERFAE